MVVRSTPSVEAPFKLQSEPGIEILDGDDLDANSLMLLAKEYNPDIIYLAGWGDKRFTAVGKYFKAKGKPVILGMDNQWLGTIKQRVAGTFGTSFLKQFSSHIWVPGLPQFPFAQRLGFSSNQILTNLYCADEKLFEDINQNTFKRQLLFVGRLVEHKGLLNLFRVLQKLLDEGRLDLRVKLIGNGPLKSKIPQDDLIEHIPFVSPEDLPEIMKNAGFFILPSLYEAWGVVVHEAVLAGLPIVSTYETGASTAFVIPNFNGFLYNASKLKDLKSIILQIQDMSEDTYFNFSKNSKTLSKKISLDFWSANLNSVITNPN
ncbi:glycosyltransferase [Algoriphagus hitonicola]|uniref:glycosyltransferase n=1 Tax=Algoriphagus hitonicola TaxID=435880 RepID=UPI001C42EBF0|nr:glycosyltransferase [Algoriphagus hitonicola]